MRIRFYLGLLSIAAIALVQPAAHASRSRSAPLKKIAAPRSGGKKVQSPRVKPLGNGFKRKASEASEITSQHQKTVASGRTGKARPSIARNVGWGTFFAAVGTASAMRGDVIGTLIGAGATAHNAVKGWLIAKRGATIAQANSIAFNAGWGTLWSGVGVHGLATGNPLAAAIGLGAGAYNFYKAGRNTRTLPGAAH